MNTVLNKLRGLNLELKTGLILWLLAIYLFLLQEYLPRGISQRFVIQALEHLFYIMAGWFVISGALYLFSSAKEYNYSNKIQTFKTSHLLLIVLPMTPVIQYIILNQDLLGRNYSFAFFAFFLTITVVTAYILPYISGVLLPRYTAMLMGITLCYFFFSMPAWALEFNWLHRGNYSIQIGLLLGIFGLLCVLFYKQREMLYVLIVVLFFVNSIQSIMTLYTDKDTSIATVSSNNPEIPPEEILRGFIKDRTPDKTPDIYLLTYDAYVPQVTMQAYGIDNQTHEDYLTDRGFKIYDGTYSIGSNTLSSMIRVLDLEYEKLNRAVTAGNGTVQNIFSEMGYRTYGAFKGGFFLRGGAVGYDKHFPPLSHSEGLENLITAVGEGQFRFELEFENVAHEAFIKSKRSMLRASTNQPKFMYTHSGPSHSQNSGKCRANETQLFHDRLLKANKEMRQDIKAILKSNKDAIIIVNGDHGPYLTGDCKDLINMPQDQIGRLEMQDRHGALLAIHWPDNNFEEYDDDKQTIQDIFPAVFSYIYKDQTPLSIKLEPVSEDVEGVYIDDGIIVNGKDHGKPLFETFEKD